MAMEEPVDKQAMTRVELEQRRAQIDSFVRQVFSQLTNVGYTREEIADSLMTCGIGVLVLTQGREATAERLQRAIENINSAAKRH